MLLWVKLIEVILQVRPKALARVLFHPDPRLRHGMRWYTRIGRRIWPYEILRWLREPLVKDGPSVAAFWGAAQDGEEEAMTPRAESRQRREAA